MSHPDIYDKLNSFKVAEMKELMYEIDRLIYQGKVQSATYGNLQNQYMKHVELRFRKMTKLLRHYKQRSVAFKLT